MTVYFAPKASAGERHTVAPRLHIALWIHRFLGRIGDPRRRRMLGESHPARD